MACPPCSVFSHARFSSCFPRHFHFKCAVLFSLAITDFNPAYTLQAVLCFLPRFRPGCPVPLRQEGCCHNPFHFLCSPPAAIRGCVPFARPCCVHCLSHCIPVHMSIAHRPVLPRSSLGLLRRPPLLQFYSCILNAPGQHGMVRPPRNGMPARHGCRLPFSTMGSLMRILP